MASALFCPTSRLPRHARLDQVALEHGRVLGGERDDDGRVIRALALVHGGDVGPTAVAARCLGRLTGCRPWWRRAVIEIGMGSVQTGECDVMGHMNVRHYISR